MDEFKHQREIHSIIRNYNPMSKICRKEEAFASRAATRQRLAVALHIRLGPRYRTELIRPDKLRSGSQVDARSRLTGRPKRAAVHTREAARTDRDDVQRADDAAPATARCVDSPRSSGTYRHGQKLPPPPSQVTAFAAYESVKGGLRNLITRSEHRRKHCLFGRSCADPSFHSGTSSPPPRGPSALSDAVSLPQLQSAPRQPSNVVSSGSTRISPRQKSPQRATSPHSPLSAVQAQEPSFFITSHHGSMPSARRSPFPTAATLQPPQSPTADRSELSWSLAKLRSTQSEEDAPAQIRTVTARDVSEQGLRRQLLLDAENGEAQERDSFGRHTQSIFDASEAKPVLRYQRQVAPSDVASPTRPQSLSPTGRAVLSPLPGRRADADAAQRGRVDPGESPAQSHVVFKRKMLEDTRSFVGRAQGELDRYDSESQQLFQQKYEALDIRQLIDKRRSASHAIRAMELKIRRQHERAWAEQRMKQQKEWLTDLQEVVGLSLPQSEPVRIIIRFLEEYIERREELAKRPEEHFEELVGRRLRRADLLLRETLSVLYLVRPVFRLSAEAFVDIVRERLRPLNQRTLETRNFDVKYKNFQINALVASFSGSRKSVKGTRGRDAARGVSPGAAFLVAAEAAACAAAVAVAAAAAPRAASVAGSGDDAPRPRLALRDFRAFLGTVLTATDEASRVARECAQTEESFCTLCRQCGCESWPDGVPALDADGLKRWYDNSYGSDAAKMIDLHYRRVCAAEERTVISVDGKKEEDDRGRRARAQRSAVEDDLQSLQGDASLTSTKRRPKRTPDGAPSAITAKFKSYGRGALQAARLGQLPVPSAQAGRRRSSDGQTEYDDDE